jgi:folate-binding protein YgfZ
MSGIEVVNGVELDAQYRAMREQAGLLDRSSRGKLVARGPEAADYLQSQITNEVEALQPGEGCYAALLDRKGHMQADMRLLRLSPAELWLDTEAGAAPALERHLRTYSIGRQVEIADESGDWAILSVIGPGAAEVTDATGLDAEHTHTELELGGGQVRAVATDLGVDVLVSAGEAEAARRALLEAGAVEVTEPAAEILRVEAGRPRFGAEMTEATIPAEAGINERAVSFEKGCYIGQETVARLHYKGKPNRHLRGLRLSVPAEPGAPLLLGEKAVGEVGTACVSPALGPIALAVVRREAQPGDTLAVGGDGITAVVTEIPFRA